MAKALPIKHIGLMRALCDRRKRAYLREDLGVDRYKVLGVSELFVGEAPYRICARCISRVGNWRWMAARHRSRMKVSTSTEFKRT